ncbi:MAG: hypothetical protein LC650_04270 [Actinobacteria bacterium]|nr:hypothetical protein [Actinomycetota bacterium]
MVSVQNIKHRPLNFEGVREDDRAVVESILETFYLLASDNQDSSTLRQTNLEIYHNTYLLTVKLRGTAVVDSSAFMAVWDASPAHIESLHLVPAVNNNTGQSFLAVNVTIRSTRASPTVRFVLHQQVKQQLRIRRSAFHDANVRHAMRLAEGPATATTTPDSHLAGDDGQIQTAAESGARKSAVKGIREPWTKLEHKLDRDAVKKILAACFDMALNPTDDRFWKRVAVRGPSPGRADRITIEWRLPSGEPFDLVALYTLHLLEPTSLDAITCGSTADGQSLCITLHLLSVVSQESSLISARVFNIYSTHVGRNASPTSGIAGPGMSYKPSSGRTPLNPTAMAERERNKKRPRETSINFPDAQEKEDRGNGSGKDFLANTTERERKRQRLLSQREQARSAEAHASVPFLGRAIGFFDSIF